MLPPNVQDLTLDDLDHLSERVFPPIVTIATDLDRARQLATATVSEVGAHPLAPAQHNRMLAVLVRRVVAPHYAGFLSQYVMHVTEYERWVPHDRETLETALREGANSDEGGLLYDDPAPVRAFVQACHDLLVRMDARFKELTY